MRSQKVNPAILVREYERSRFLRATDISQDKFLGFDIMAHACLPENYIPVELSPLSPLGSISALTNLSQNLVVSTARNSEIVSDPTNVLALEAALLRKTHLRENHNPGPELRLCTSHRLLRAQAFENEKFSAHFRVFSLATAGRDTGNYSFEKQQLAEHLGFYLELSRKLGIIGRSKVLFSDFTGRAPHEVFDSVRDGISRKYPEAEIAEDNNRSQARNYYSPIAFRIQYTDEKGDQWDIVDGGFTDWTQKLVDSRKERFLGSAIGSELLLRVFPGSLSG